MRFMNFLDPEGEPRLGVSVDGVMHDVTHAVPGGRTTELSPMRHLLSRGTDLREVAAAAAGSPVARIARALPVVPDPTKIVAAPVNYRDHQHEMTADAAVDGLGVFLKSPSSLIGDGGTVRLPYTDRRFDQEGELAVIIGRTASHVAAAGALDYLAGYTCLLDMTMRGGEDRSIRKSFDTFTPTGPYLVTPDEAGPVEEMELHTWVGGELRQRADLRDLIWNVPRLIEYVSSAMVLYPGDVIATGTPAGVGQVLDGQEVAVEITNLGRLTVSVSNVGAVACPTLGKDRGPKPPAGVAPPRERLPRPDASGSRDRRPATEGVP
jgi:2-keto-4-pentenoate hydratase/2-oxohepta-3-ene-1,7-dioic acid hydratase in catechol pathway